ncbi:hypothetical protein U1Q18_020718 [Sarracenia purpurea var. burkii]
MAKRQHRAGGWTGSVRQHGALELRRLESGGAWTGPGEVRWHRRCAVGWMVTGKMPVVGDNAMNGHDEKETDERPQ